MTGGCLLGSGASANAGAATAPTKSRHQVAMKTRNCFMTRSPCLQGVTPSCSRRLTLCRNPEQPTALMHPASVADSTHAVGGQAVFRVEPALDGADDPPGAAADLQVVAPRRLVQ